MRADYPGGYAGKILHVDLTNEHIREEALDKETLRKYIGGVGLGTKFLYEKVVPGVEWSDPENRIIWATGPLGGTSVPGSGTSCVVTKGPMTNGAASSQANGFFGAFLKLSGFDGIVVDGAAKKWRYLYIHDGTAELRDASHLFGKDNWETDDALNAELGGGKGLSVCSIGPAGENRVRFAMILCDRSHVFAHNGVGAVMGSKKLKAIAVARGKSVPQVVDKQKLDSLVKELVHKLRERVSKGAPTDTIKNGTPASFSYMNTIAALPVKNYLAHNFPEHAKFANLRADHEAKRNPCWACPTNHSASIKITQGPYAGYQGEEPEYEGLAAFGPQILQPDPGAGVMLSDLADRLGMDVNELGWVIGWVMECYEKGLLTKNDTDGLEMTWGNVKGTEALLRKIANREGFGDLLAEGVKRAAEKIGGESLNCAIYTMKGAAPRSHDHRAWQNEMLDTCLSNTGTVEVGGGFPQPHDLGLPPRMDWHNPWEVVMLNAMINGRRQFEDTTGTCRFCYDEFKTHTDILNAITGWNFTPDDAMEVGRRIINQLRVFNLRHGFTKDLEAPSARYGSIPAEGPYKGKSIVPYWDFMRRTHYQLMGWDPKSGKPLPETLDRLGLSHLIADLK